jgi:hypothetical protein
MKRLFAYVLLISSFLVLVAGSSPVIMSAIDKWIPSPYTYGDLYMFSNLRKFKNGDVLKGCPVMDNSRTKMNDVNVFVIGDSYMYCIPQKSFNENNYNFIHWDEPAYKTPFLDSQKKNILFIESSERYFRQRLQTPANNMLIVQKGYVLPEEKNSAPSLFNLKAEDDLTYLLTYNNIACYLKETKAWINLHVFNHIDKSVSLSKDRQHIFLSETTDSTFNTSSFNPLHEAEFNNIIQNLNSTYHHFLSIGFSGVYLTIIPNEVSIVTPQEGNYNHLIERIEKSPALEMPVIDLYYPFKKAPDQFYFNSDTHWNCEGSNVWMQKVDSVLYLIEKNSAPGRP